MIAMLRSYRTEQNEMLRIVLLGTTGTGKSATGNTILGKQAFESRMCGNSVTTCCRSESNSMVQVIDTPGFFDSRVTNNEIKEEIAKCIAMSAPGPHAFIIVVTIDRFTQQEADTVKLIKETFGEEVMRYMIVLFVRKDELDAKKISIDEFLTDLPVALKLTLKECENKNFFFNNLAEAEEKKLQSRKLLDIVKAIVERNGGTYYTDAMYVAAEDIMHTEEVKRKRDLEEKTNKQIEAIRKQIVQANEVQTKRYQDRITELERQLKVAKAAVRKSIVNDIMHGRFTRVGIAILKVVIKIACSIM